jgi:hypothetical protein
VLLGIFSASEISEELALPLTQMNSRISNARKSKLTVVPYYQNMIFHYRSENLYSESLASVNILEQKNVVDFGKSPKSASSGGFPSFNRDIF